MAGNDSNTILLLHFDEFDPVGTLDDSFGGIQKNITWVNGEPAVVVEIVNVSSNMTMFSKVRNLFVDDPVPDIFFEVTMRQTTGKMTARLFDLTAGAPVSDSQVQTTSGSFVRVRSAAIVIDKDHDFQREMGVNDTDAGEIVWSQIIGV